MLVGQLLSGVTEEESRCSRCSVEARAGRDFFPRFDRYCSKTVSFREMHGSLPIGSLNPLVALGA